MDLRKLKTIIDLFENSLASELEIFEGEDKIRLFKHKQSTKRPSEEGLNSPDSETPASPALKADPSQGPLGLSDDEREEILTSPMVGTFYRSPTPEGDPFVLVGDKVQKGQVVCIIEAMKLMNEISAPCDGIVGKVLVENSSPVGYGDPLIVINVK